MEYLEIAAIIAMIIIVIIIVLFVFTNSVRYKKILEESDRNEHSEDN